MVLNDRSILYAKYTFGFLFIALAILTLITCFPEVHADTYSVRTTSYEEAASPQLSIESVIPEKHEVERNENVNITVTIRNDGDEEARYVDIRYEKDGAYQYFRTIDSIPPESSVAVNFSFSESTVGEYNLTYTGVDDGVEFDEESITVTVIGPTHYVDDDAPEGGDGSKEHPYNEIREAIDNAAPGDTIRVYEGMYYENVRIDKTLSMVGNSSTNTTIDGEYDGDVVIISGNWVNFTGFSVINCGPVKNCLKIQSDFNTIHNTTCSVNVDYYPEMEAGIFLDSSYQNTIVHNNLTNNTIGLYMRYSYSNFIRLNEFSKNTDVGKNSYDIYMSGGYNNTIEENSFQKMKVYQSDRNSIFGNTCNNGSITIGYCEHNNLSKNILYNSLIELQSAHNSSLIDNQCTTDLERCIDIENTANLTISGNRMIGGGLTISGCDYDNWNTHTIDSTNTVNGKEIYYRTNSSGFEIPDGFGQIILANCTDAVVRDKTYTNVSGGILIGYSSDIRIIGVLCTLNYQGVYIEYSDNITISESDFSGNYYGVAMDSSQDILFHNNNCSNNDNSGMDLEQIINITIRHNVFYSNIQSGIGCDYGVHFSLITNNICKGNRDGIRISMCYAPNLVTNNICDNNRRGIYVPDSRYTTLMNNSCANNEIGIYVRDTNIANMTNNTASDNTIAGFYFREAWDCYVINSTISDNVNGILFQSDFFGSGSYNISVHYNNIWGNSEFGANATDNDETSNDCTLNWWGDASGPYHEDDNPDGKGDRITDYVEFDPWLPRKVRPPTADFIVSPYFDTDLAIDDSNDPIENGIIDVFYGDRIVFQQRASDPEDDPLTFEWMFHCDSSKYETTAFGDVVSGMVGMDFLYEGLDGSDPIYPDSILDYTVTIFVSDEVSIVTKEYSIRVHPYATAEFQEQVNLGHTLLEATVLLTWRGFEEEAAPAKQYISPDKPVFVFIDADATSPDEDLNEKGGIGPVYEIWAVGCWLQNGDEGFIEAEISVPILTAQIADIGELFILQDDLRLEYYDDAEERFCMVVGSEVRADGGVKYVTGTVDHFSIFSAIVDSLYNASHPNHYQVLPDLLVFRIEFSRTPVLNGQVVEVTGYVKNTGPTHGKNVEVTFYNGDVLFGTRNLDIVESSSGTELVKETFIATMRNPEDQFEGLDITVFVNEHQTIEEAPQNYDNNMKQELLTVVHSLEGIPIPQIITPEDGTTVSKNVTIQGTIAYAGTVVMKTDQPFGNNDFAWSIEKTDPIAVPIYFVYYTLLDHEGEGVPGGEGDVKDIYGLNFDDVTTNISFGDNDRDGMISAGDVFLVKNIINGGIVSEDHSLELEFVKADTVSISIDYGEWIPLEGTDSWAYEWNTSSVENGEHSLRVQAVYGGEYSDPNELTVTVLNIPDNSIPDVQILSPLNHSVVSGTTMITGLASDEDGSIEKVEISIHNGSWQEVQVTTSWTYEWNTKEMENGEYVIWVRSFDGEDYSPVVSITVTVNNKEDSDDDGMEIAGIDAIILIPLIIVCIALVIVGVIARTRSQEEVRSAAPKKKFICPMCESPVSFIKEKKRWVCHRCKKFIQPIPVQPRPRVRDCPTCGEEATYTEEYEDHYCWSCEKYINDMEE